MSIAAALMALASSEIAPALVTGAASIGTSLISGGLQSRILKEGEEKEYAKWREELALTKEAQKKQDVLTRRQLSESRRQFNISTGLQREQLGMQKESMARQTFQNRVSMFSSLLNSNEQLKNLFVNRLSTL